MHDQPEATEEEQGAGPERRREEDAMRGADDEDAQTESAGADHDQGEDDAN